MTSMDIALHHLSKVVPMLDIIRGDAGLDDDEVFDLTRFETDIPVKDGFAVQPGTADVEYVYRNGYRFDA